MIIQKRLFILGLILFLFSCNFLHNDKDNVHFFNKDMNQIVDDYVQENPLSLPIEKNLYQNGFSYPSYHIYFDKKENDTILTIVQLPHLTEIRLDGYESNQDKGTYIHDYIKVKGFCLYKEKFPIVIFDEDSIGRKFYNKTKLSIVPDSLKFNEENYHIKLVRWDYIIDKGKFKRK